MLVLATKLHHITSKLESTARVVALCCCGMRLDSNYELQGRHTDFSVPRMILQEVVQPIEGSYK